MKDTKQPLQIFETPLKLDSLVTSSDYLSIKIGLSVILAIALLLAFIQLTFRTPMDSEATIEHSRVLKDHDSYCLKLPRPSDFSLESKMTSGNAGTIAISYWFQSELRFADVKDFYERNLEADNWLQTELSEDEMTPIPKHINFKKDSYTIAIELVKAAGPKPAEYSVYCARDVR